jgi:two-component system, OmpR family, sensor histidine kinase KdpD
MIGTIRQTWVGYALAIGGVAFVVVLYTLLITNVNATTMALSFLLIVLLVASIHGLGPAIVASVVGMLCFNFFFLPPIGKFTIHGPQNWVALFAFLITAIIASQLSSMANTRARDAEKRREEVWKLYQLSQAIIITPDSETASSSLARQVVEIFGVPYCAVWIPKEEGGWKRLAMATELSKPNAFNPDLASIQTVFSTGELKLIHATGLNLDGELTLDKKAPLAVIYAPLKVGVRMIGVVVLISASIERGTVEAVAGLMALALERARFLQAMSHTEALRQSDELKSALLASVSHNLRTPLTAIRAAVDSLLKEDISWDQVALHEFHLIISEETYRLTRLVENLLEMARIEAGELHLMKQWISISELFSNVLDRCAAVTRDHQIVVELNDESLNVWIDTRLVSEVLTNLIENAAKYSPMGSEITLSGLVRNDELLIGVKDQGPGIAPEESNHIFNKFYRGKQLPRQGSEGTGMGLAIASGIVEAHGGRIWVESILGQGSTFCFSLPNERKDTQFVLTERNYD